MHSFDPQEAAQYGVDEAVMIHNLRCWVRHNRANRRNHHQGKTWTFNSYSAWAELFPYWSKKQVRRILNSLKEQGVIVAKQLQKDEGDQTYWYAFCDEAVFLDDTHRAQTGTPRAQMGNSYTYTTPSNKKTAHTREEEPPTIEQVRTKAEMSGVPKSTAEAFYYHFAGRDWTDGSGRPIRKWDFELMKWHRTNQSWSDARATESTDAIPRADSYYLKEQVRTFVADGFSEECFAAVRVDDRGRHQYKYFPN